MYFLDSDNMSLQERGTRNAEGELIRNRLRSVPLDDVATAIISYEEQTCGRMADLLAAPNPKGK